MGGAIFPIRRQGIPHWGMVLPLNSRISRTNRKKKGGPIISSGRISYYPPLGESTTGTIPQKHGVFQPATRISEYSNWLARFSPGDKGHGIDFQY
jgi:hypothetical protein